MQANITLTVSESKKLIALGLVKLPEVRKAKKSGLIAIATGSTNSYVLEKLLGRKIDKTSYRSGLVMPKGKKLPGLSKEIMPDVVLEKGKINKKLDRFTVVEKLQAGDIYIKGANALNYREKVAGILIGHPQSGTIGAAYGTIIGRRVHLIIPVGLEKQISTDIPEVHRRLAEPGTRGGPRIMPVFGTVFTEIEALEILAGVQAIQCAAGGIGGAEGCVGLLLSGTKAALDKAAEKGIIPANNAARRKSRLIKKLNQARGSSAPEAQPEEAGAK